MLSTHIDNVRLFHLKWEAHMEKVKSVGFIAGLMLLAAVMIYLSAKGLLTIPSAI